MIRYSIKRVLIFIPTLIAISLITFFISAHAPGDPVDTMLGRNSGNTPMTDKLAGDNAYNELQHKLGLDLPLFYFSFGSLAEPDTLYKIPDKQAQENLSRLVHRYGNWSQIQIYFNRLKSTISDLKNIPVESSTADNAILLRGELYKLSLNNEPPIIDTCFSDIQSVLHGAGKLSALTPDFENIEASYHLMTTQTSTWKNYIPVIHFYGLNNQYHHWITKFIMGDFGISYHDSQPVADVLWDSAKWTLLISILSVILTYLIAVPLGVNSAIHKNSVRDQASSTFLFVLYSLPNFWIATLLIIFFCGGDYLHLFPSYGLGDLDASAPFFQRVLDVLYHLVLPLICWTYPAFAFLSRQMRGGMLNVINQDFIRTAKAKGLDDKKVYWKHAFRNSLLPVITLFTSIFPLVLSGSVVLEYIFTIPGMGKLTYDAISERNYPVVYAVTMFSALLTLVAFLAADILYAAVDPRISFSKKQKT